MPLKDHLRIFERAYLRPFFRQLGGGKSLVLPSPEDALRMTSLGHGQLGASQDFPRIALLSVLPPSRTGLASYALRHFGDPRWQVDHYAPFLHLAEMEALLEAGPRDRRFFPASDLGRLLPLHAYRALLFQIGNSAHHVPALKALLEAPEKPAPWIYLHEAQLGRFWLSWCRDDPRQVRRLYDEHYPESRITLSEVLGRPGADSPRGIRPLLAMTGCTRVIVNSACCEEMVKRDLGPGWTGEMLRLFHPIPGGPQPPGQGQGPLRIGHFGGIGTGKGVPLLLKAVRQIRASRPVVLVLAGFDAGRWARRHRLEGLDWVEVLDAPGDARLFQAMGSVDVAVQLRPVTQGESSGVVSQLLGLGRRVIATGVGSFLEYEGALHLVPPEVDAAGLAGHILEALTENREEAILHLQRTHSAEAFHAHLWDALFSAAPPSQGA